MNLKKLHKVVNHPLFITVWFIYSYLLFFLSINANFKGFTWLFLLTFVNGFLDIILGYWYTRGLSLPLIWFNIFINLTGQIVQFSTGLYGGTVNSLIGMFLLLFKAFTWNKVKDGKISHYQKTEFKLSYFLGIVGIVLLGIIYGFLFRGTQPIYLVSLNVLVFCLGILGRLLILKGKAESQLVYISRGLVDVIIFLVMLSIGTATNSVWIRFAGTCSSLVSLFRAAINWYYLANKNK